MSLPHQKENNYGFGQLALTAGEKLPLEILQSFAGFYIGTQFYDPEIECMAPFTRESIQYWKSKEAAEEALRSGLWTQKGSL